MEAPKVRGRGSCKFSAAFGGSGLLSWTSDDPNSKPSKEALDRQRSKEEGGRTPLPPPPPPPGERQRLARCRCSRDGPADLNGRRGSRRRKRSEEASSGLERKSRRYTSGSRQRRHSRRVEPRRTTWVRVVNVPTIVQSQQLQHLFKTSLGKVVSCSVDDGIATVCFESPEHAEKAVAKYDGGEINGCTISVQLDFMPKKSAQPPAAQGSPERRPKEQAADRRSRNGKCR